MSINAYIEKLRRKPARERERIAIVATGVAFAVIFVIWLVSFSEMNRGSADQTDSGAVSTQAQFNDLKNNFGQGKQSIQDMLQQMPNQQDLNNALQSPDQSGGAGTDSSGSGVDSGNPAGDNSNTDTSGAPSIQDLQTAPDSGNGSSSTDNNSNQSGSNTNPSGTAQPPSNPSGGGNNPGAGSIPALP